MFNDFKISVKIENPDKFLEEKVLKKKLNVLNVINVTLIRTVQCKKSKLIFNYLNERLLIHY